MGSGSAEDLVFSFCSDDIFGPFSNSRVTDSPDQTKSRKLSVKEQKILRSEIGSTCQKRNDRRPIIAGLWRHACAMVLRRGDPWAEFCLDKLPVELARRYRYSPIKSTWVEDIVRVRMESKPFGRGAMRQCFRVKKLSNFTNSDDWSHASNFVAKEYVDPVETNVYFEDVRLQLDAKLWAEEFSRQPAIIKKVDISQMCVLEFFNRPNKPLFHLEHFIEGTYRKYNSNSGFVDELARNTPQAFSHFTFEQSGHRCLVVDIQGVGDLWTDPQIHTADGKAYGDGNLGLRGMALFFHTHRCNPLCKALCLDPFDLHPEEQKRSSLIPQLIGSVEAFNNSGDLANDPQNMFGATVALPRSRLAAYRRLRSETGGNEEGCFVDPADFTEAHSLPTEKFAFLPASSPVVSRALNMNISEQLRLRGSNNFMKDSFSYQNEDAGFRSDSFSEDRSPCDPLCANGTLSDSGVCLGTSNCAVQFRLRRESGRNDLACSDGTDCINADDTEVLRFFEARRAGHRSSSVVALHGQNAEILGSIHHELARLHASGRFAARLPSDLESPDSDKPLRDGSTSFDALAALHKPKNINWEAVIFHEEQAAFLHCLEAIEGLAEYYLNLPVDGPLEECPIKPDPADSAIRGLTLISTAASAGDRRSMLYLAEINYAGNGPLKEIFQEPDWLTAAHWYLAAIKADECAKDVETVKGTVGYDSMSIDWPVYRLHGRLAEMYAKGGYGLQQNCSKAYTLFESAADGANEAMQARLAMQYYDQAALLEESYGTDT